MRYKYLFEKKNLIKLLYVSRNNRMNKAVEAEYEAVGEGVKVLGFYHAYCLCDDWKSLVADQFGHLRASGLYERMDKIYCSVVCNDSQLSDFELIGGASALLSSTRKTLPATSSRL